MRAETLTGHGRIISVDSVLIGSHLAADAAAGATTITVVNAIDFAEDGGTLVINGQVIDYSAVDDPTGSIILATGLSAAAVEGDAVSLWNAARGAAWDEKRATVQFDGDDGTADPIVADVAQGLVATLPEGVRDTGESVRLENTGDQWRVVDVNGALPDLVAPSITGGTVDGISPHTVINPDGTVDFFLGTESGDLVTDGPGKMQATVDGTGQPYMVIASPYNSGYAGQVLLMWGPGKPTEIHSIGDVNLMPAAGSGVLLGAGRKIRAADFGTTSVTFDASGNATVPHQLGVSPASVLSDTATSVRDVYANNLTATSFDLHLIDKTGAAVGGETRSIRWLAIA